MLYAIFRALKICALLLVMLPVGCVAYVYVYSKLHLTEHHLSFVPDALNVTDILYVKEDSWGFGPGGNETGVIVYKMPETVANEIKTRGLAYFESLPQNQYNRDREWMGSYDDWKETPILRDEQSGVHSYEDDKDHPGDILKIDDYLDEYGFGIPIDAEVKSLIDQAISHSGSYYAYGRIGVIIIVPDAQRIIYAYNG